MYPGAADALGDKLDFALIAHHVMDAHHAAHALEPVSEQHTVVGLRGIAQGQAAMGGFGYPFDGGGPGFFIHHNGLYLGGKEGFIGDGDDVQTFRQ